MIPVKLSMRNFMCYRENVPPLFFEGIHTACISGSNGNGKSALVDAMTWALWGRARARSDDDLVHSGQREMEVEFDFRVGEPLYRIIRKHSRPRRQRASGQTILEFQIASEDGFRSITGNTIAETQQKIINVLHMDYATFINSALLLQGRADEFTIKRPTERKQVLADILGLSFYDELEEEARNLARQQEMEIMQLENAIKDIDDELAQKPACQAEFEQAQSRLAGIEKVIKEKEARVNSLRREKESLENKRLQLMELEERIRSAEKGLERWNAQIQQHCAKIKEYEELIARRSAIEEGYAQLIEARKLSHELDQKFRQSVNLERQKSQLENKIREAGQSRLTEHALAQSRIKELEASYQRLPQLKNQLQPIQIEVAELGEEEKRLSQKRQGSQERRTKVNYLESNQKQLEREITEIEEKLGLLLTGTGARCPLCETELGTDGIELIQAKYEADKGDKFESLKTNQAELAHQKIELELLEKEISRREIKLNQDRAAAQGEASILNRTISEVEEAGNRLKGERERLAEIELSLARREFALMEQQAIHQLEEELAKLGYRPPQHEEVRQRLAALEQYEDPKRRLEEADRLINQEKEALSGAEEAAQELRRSLAADGVKSQELNEKLKVFPQLASDLAQTEADYRVLADQQREAQQILGSARAKLERCSELEMKRKEKERALSQASREENIYKELAQAFGKKGIQALLIEMALPEIETEANRLLARMTDNRMHIKIETQRETKKGDVLETLDINIADELGTRNYEMFSGGEAFRINFAVRIALSKLLARRAGTPLRTLVIDEGFGTQDSVGIEKLKEAINSIQEDFDKILVITHVEELRDAFPTRIEVTKTAEGSALSIAG